MIFFDKITATLHRLADSRKVIIQTLLAFSGVITESVNIILMWAQIFGANAEKQKNLEYTLHAVAATLTLLGNRLADMMTREDVALKTTLPPPDAPHLRDQQTNTVTVNAGPAPVPPDVLASRKIASHNSNLG